MRLFITSLLLGTTLLSSGCASIVSGSNQSLSVTAMNKAAVVSAATCKLTNNKGTWYVNTPGSVTVHRSYEDLLVACDKEGLETGMLTVKSSTKGMAFGNILFGGVIGAGVDVGTGAAYDYPSLVTVQMGEAGTVVPSPSADQSAAEFETSQVASPDTGGQAAD